MKVKPIGLDFETRPIDQRPHYPPEPVSFSLQLPEWRAPKFYAWGHLTGGNNCSKADAARVLKTVWQRASPAEPILCHNVKFDLDVAEEWFDLALPPWDCYEDTMFLLFLEDPHQRELGLKPSAQRLLNMPPGERDAVQEWILAHKKQLEADFPEVLSVGAKPGENGGIKPSTAGAFIAYAPGTVVGPYANGDVARALKLFALLHPRVTVERGMRAAYDRERRFMPIMLRNEREGIVTDRELLEKDRQTYEAAQLTVDNWLRKTLKAPDLDFDKDRQVAEALDKAGAVKEWNLTSTGQLSVSKNNLKQRHFTDPKVGAAYSYRQRCATVLETFIRPWLYYSREDGRMHTTWNQVRQVKGNDTGGTRTGRPSSDTPNFLNMPKPFKEGGVSEYVFPRHIKGLPELPKVRRYIVPDEKGHWIGRRDFNQQELRLLAHFEDGAGGEEGMLLRAYLMDPRLDVHEFTRLSIEELIGIDVGRPTTKTLNFGYIYGQGFKSLAEKLDQPVDEVQGIRNAQMAALPGLKRLSDDIKKRSRAGLPIVTWGGREYYAEEPRVINGQYRDFVYKLLNYLIQGSAADVTKESIIRYDSVRRDGRFILTVYDENNISAPKKALPAEMLRLREAMMSIELDVPLISDGEWGPTLGDLTDLKEPEPDLSRWSL